MSSGSAVAAGVLSGSFDFGKSSMTTLFEAHDKGIPFALVTPSVLYETKTPYTAFIVAKDAVLQTGKDFANQLIAVSARFTTKDYSAKHPDVVRAFGRAWSESATYTNAHHTDTVAMMAEFTGASLGVVQRMTRAIAAPTLVPAQIQPVIDAAAKYGAIKRSFPARELIDPNAMGN